MLKVKEACAFSMLQTLRALLEMDDKDIMANVSENPEASMAFMSLQGILDEKFSKEDWEEFSEAMDDIEKSVSDIIPKIKEMFKQAVKED